MFYQNSVGAQQLHPRKSAYRQQPHTHTHELQVTNIVTGYNIFSLDGFVPLMDEVQFVAPFWSLRRQLWKQYVSTNSPIFCEHVV
jgi:hypothetical protein